MRNRLALLFPIYSRQDPMEYKMTSNLFSRYIILILISDVVVPCWMKPFKIFWSTLQICLFSTFQKIIIIIKIDSINEKSLSTTNEKRSQRKIHARLGLNTKSPPCRMCTTTEQCELFKGCDVKESLRILIFNTNNF